MAGYALRKFWLKNGLEKELSSAGFKLEVAARSTVVVDALGLLSPYKIKTSIVCIRYVILFL